MKAIRFILECFEVLLTPSCWIQNHQYSRRWDKILSQLMLVRNFEILNNCEAKIGEHRVWIKNHPYASFSFTISGAFVIRPSRRTILRAHKKLINDSLNQGQEIYK